MVPDDQVEFLFIADMLFRIMKAALRADCRHLNLFIMDEYTDTCYSGPGWTGRLAFIEPRWDFAY